MPTTTDAPPITAPSPPTTPVTRQPEQVPGAPPGTTVEVVADRLSVPWSVAFVPDGRAFVTERDTGRLLVVEPDGRVQPVQQLSVDPSGEGGLLGVTASPSFAVDNQLYAYLSTPVDNRVVRFVPGGEATPVVTGIPHGSNHNGGRLAFGPDGMLYVGTGDAGSRTSAQDPDSLGGKILRFTPDGAVPSDNPRPDSPVWSLGHRNVQGLAWDSSGRLYATEFGPDVDDELNLIVAAGNYGWPEVTGTAGDPRYVDPVAVLQPGEASPSGATILGAASGAWSGNLLFGGLRGERIWRAPLAESGLPASLEATFVGSFGRVRDVVAAPDGSVWVLTSNRDGRGRPAPDDDRILRVVPPPS